VLGGLGSLSVQPERRVGVELANHTVAGGEDGGGQDDTKWEQLDGDLLERA